MTEKENVHSIDDWMQMIVGADASAAIAEAAAGRILSELHGYKQASQARTRDRRELGNAIQAYARLLVKHGLTAEGGTIIQGEDPDMRT